MASLFAYIASLLEKSFPEGLPKYAVRALTLLFAIVFVYVVSSVQLQRFF
jgi:hypothetical protein